MSRNDATLQNALRDFLAQHPDGWSHGEWQQLLSDLQARGVSTSDEAEIGSALERERLLVELRKTDVRGMGPKRREAIADRFGRLWELRQASPDEVAERSGVPRRIAEELVSAIRA